MFSCRVGKSIFRALARTLLHLPDLPNFCLNLSQFLHQNTFLLKTTAYVCKGCADFEHDKPSIILVPLCKSQSKFHFFPGYSLTCLQKHFKKQTTSVKPLKYAKLAKITTFRVILHFSFHVIFLAPNLTTVIRYTFFRDLRKIS